MNITDEDIIEKAFDLGYGWDINTPIEQQKEHTAFVRGMETMRGLIEQSQAPVIDKMLIQKEAIDFVMWCKLRGEFVYQYECNRDYNEVLYRQFKSI